MGDSWVLPGTTITTFIQIYVSPCGQLLVSGDDLDDTGDENIKICKNHDDDV